MPAEKRGRGQPKRPGARRSVLPVRLSEEGRALVEEAAARARRSVSDWSQAHLVEAAARELAGQRGQ